MKFVSALLVFSVVITVSKGDVLRLRDGTELTGRYLGGNQTQIWFERQGMVTTMEAFPVGAVEGLRFGPTLLPPANGAIHSPSGSDGARPSQAQIVRMSLRPLFTNVLASVFAPPGLNNFHTR